MIEGRALAQQTKKWCNTADVLRTPFSLQIVLPPHLERIREKLAENSHELWAVTRIEQGWTFAEVSCLWREPQMRTHLAAGDSKWSNRRTSSKTTMVCVQVRDDNKKLHPCLVDFQGLPEPEKNYNLAMSGETLKWALQAFRPFTPKDFLCTSRLYSLCFSRLYLQTIFSGCISRVYFLCVFPGCI